MLCFHKWNIKEVGKYMRGLDCVTLILWGCKRCKKSKTEEIDGHWTKKEVTEVETFSYINRLPKG